MSQIYTTGYAAPYGASGRADAQDIGHSGPVGKYRGEAVSVASRSHSILAKPGHYHQIHGHQHPHIVHQAVRQAALTYGTRRSFGSTRLPIDSGRRRRNSDNSAAPISTGVESSSTSLIPADKIQEYLDRTHDQDDAEQLLELAKQLGKADEDPAKQYVALLYAAQVAEDENRVDDAENIYEALAELERNYGDEIRAKLNTTPALEGLDTAAQVQEFQNKYCSVVLDSHDENGKQDLHKTMTALIEHFGGTEDFAKQVNRFLEAAGHDLASIYPSDTRRLKHICDNVSDLQVVLTVVDHSKKLCMRTTLQIDPALHDGVKLSIGVIGLTADAWPSSSGVMNLAAEFINQKCSATVEFLIGVNGLLAKMPVKVFTSTDALVQLRDIMQTAIDAAVEREEREQQEQQEEPEQEEQEEQEERGE